MFRLALFAVLLVAAASPGEALAQPKNGGGGQKPTPAAPTRDCTTEVRTVSDAICSSGRQRVRICTGGGQPRTVQPLNCL